MGRDAGGCLFVCVVVVIIALMLFWKEIASLLCVFICVFGVVAGISWVIDKREEKKREKQVEEEEERKRQEEEERWKQGEERRKQEVARIIQSKEEIIAELCSCILLPDTCFLMDLGGANDFSLWFEDQCMKCFRKVILHRHVYQEIQRLYNGEDREKSKKAQNAKKLIERWQKLGIVQTYPDLEDKEKSYYADDALLKYMGELLEKGEKVRLLTNDLDLRIRARDRFEKLGKALPEDMLLSLDDILAKWPR